MNFLGIIAALAQILSWSIIARIVLRMLFPVSAPNSTVQFIMDFLYRITEPILAPIRRIVYRGGPFDLSPMLAILFLWMISVVFSTL